MVKTDFASFVESLSGESKLEYHNYGGEIWLDGKLLGEVINHQCPSPTPSPTLAPKATEQSMWSTAALSSMTSVAKTKVLDLVAEGDPFGQSYLLGHSGHTMAKYKIQSDTIMNGGEQLNHVIMHLQKELEALKARIAILEPQPPNYDEVM